MHVLAGLVAFMMIAHAASAAEQVTLYTAGSLKAALTDVTEAYGAAHDTSVAADFAASGLLPERRPT